MQSAEHPATQDFVATFSLQRQRLLHHAGGVLGESGDSTDPATTRLSQMLLTSLELLKVAEEELREEQRAGAMRSMVQERRIAHLTAMFEAAPAVLVLTTADTSIREANHAAAALLGRNSYELSGRRLCDMVSAGQRLGFREQLAQAIEIGTVASWSFGLDLHRTMPVTVVASVRLVDDPAVGTRALYWSLRPV